MRKFLVIPLLLLLTACSDPYGACVKAGADIGTGIGQGMHTVDQLRVAGVISPSEESNVLGYLKFANDGDKAFLVCVQAVHTAGAKGVSFTSCAQDFNTSLNNPSELLLIHVNSQVASQNISVIINGIATGISSLEAALGGA